MYQKPKFDKPFCGLSMRLFPTGNQSPKYEYSGEASKVKFTCSLTKRKYGLSQVNDWFNTPEVQEYTKAGYVLKYMTKTQEMQNPPQYAKGNLEQIICLVMIKLRPQQPNVDGFKPIGQTMPTYKEQPMTQAQPSAPDHAVPVQNMNDMDDEIPF
jgi:hypothetical protein